MTKKRKLLKTMQSNKEKKRNETALKTINPLQSKSQRFITNIKNQINKIIQISARNAQ